MTCISNFGFWKIIQLIFLFLDSFYWNLEKKPWEKLVYFSLNKTGLGIYIHRNFLAENIDVTSVKWTSIGQGHSIIFPPRLIPITIETLKLISLVMMTLCTSLQTIYRRYISFYIFHFFYYIIVTMSFYYCVIMTVFELRLIVCNGSGKHK